MKGFERNEMKWNLLMRDVDGFRSCGKLRTARYLVSCIGSSYLDSIVADLNINRSQLKVTTRPGNNVVFDT